MFHFLLIVSSICIYNSLNVQAVFRFVIEDSYFEEINHLYLADNSTAYANHEGLDSLSLNVTVIHTLPDDSIGSFEIIGESMGEFEIPMGIEIQEPICEMLDDQLIVGPFLAALGFDKNDCPPKPGTFGCENYRPDDALFPDDFLPNKYLIKFKITSDSNLILELRIFFEIQ